MAVNKYLIFDVNEKNFSVCFDDVKIILAAVKPQPIPDFPDYVLGTIVNLEQVVPVIDIRRRFNYPSKEISDRDCIIVTDCEKPVGLLVDKINGFVEVEDEKIQPAVHLNNDASARFLKGEFVASDGKVFCIIDPNLVVKLEDEEIIDLCRQ